MIENFFIAGDWGTTKLRLYLCEYREQGRSRIIKSLEGPGASHVSGDFEPIFFRLANPWIAVHGPVPVILSGMVGSTIGWRDAPYLECPVGIEEVAEGRVMFEARGLTFSIISGLKTNNLLDLPDVMRGEELQLLGWERRFGGRSTGRRLIALPGTHNKWAVMNEGRIEIFQTALTGEMFAVLKDHSVLIARGQEENFDQERFITAVDLIKRNGPGHLIQALFSTRSQQVVGAMQSAEASSYLSGLLIAADVISAMELVRKFNLEHRLDLNSVIVIGDSQLSECYRMAIENLGKSVDKADANDIAIAGFEAIYQYLYRRA